MDAISNVVSETVAGLGRTIRTLYETDPGPDGPAPSHHAPTPSQVADAKAISNLRAWTDEGRFQELLKTGRPIAVAMVIPSHPTCTALRGPLLEAAKACPEVEFVWVNCSRESAVNFCRGRSPTELPTIHVFQADPNEQIVEVKAFNHDWSVHGWKSFFNKHGFTGTKSDFQ